MMVLHILRKDGSVDHVPMTRASWEQALRDPTVSRQWSHKPEDCTDHLIPFLERLKSRSSMTENKLSRENGEQEERTAAVKRVIDLSLF